MTIVDRFSLVGAAVQRWGLRRRSKTASICGLLCVLVFGPATLHAIGEQHGIVKFGGLPVPGALVTASQGDKKFTAVTDPQGVYAFPDLPDGRWAFQVEMAGFTTIRQDVTIAPDAPPQEWELKLMSFADMVRDLPPSALESRPVPTPAETPAAPRSNGAAKAPANGASAARAAAAAKGAPAAGTQSSFQRADLNAAAGAAAAATAGDSGSASNESAADLAQRAADGLLINGSVNNGAASPFAQLAAFGNNRRTRALYSGAFGLILGNSALDAQAYSLTGLNTPKPAYNHVVGAFSIGGPLKIPGLVKNGPTFFLSYQRLHNSNATSQSAIMPGAAERSGDLSAVAGAILDPATGQPFPGNVIPQDRISPQARALLSYFPLPNFAAADRYNYQVPVIAATHQDSMQSRLSKTVNPRNQLFGDFAFQRTASDNTNVFGFLDTTQILGLNGTANWLHRYSQRFSTTLKYQFSRLRTRLTPNFANKSNVSRAAGISGNNQEPINWGPPALVFSGGTANLSDAQALFNRNQTHAISVSSLWSHSPHSFTIGGDVRRQHFNVLSQQDPRGTFTFTGAATGSDFADFLLGIPAASSIAFGNADKYLRQWVYDAFITDDWRVRTGLTLNIGVRYEYEQPVRELYGRLVNLDIAPGFAAATPVVAGMSGASLLRDDLNGFQPRIGLAWRPFPASSMIVRAGYGVYRNPNVYQPIVLQMAQQAPLSKSFNVQNSAAGGLTLANGFNTPSSNTPSTYAVDPNFRIGYAQTWNASIQRDLPASLMMTAVYTGTKGTRLMQESLPNTYPAGAVNPCPSCPSGFTYLTSNGNSSRHSGQFTLRRRLHNGLTASIQYTLSKSIDDAGFSAINPLIAQNWLDLAADRALSSFDQRHQVMAQVQYTTGMGVGGGTLMSGWRGALFKEWTITSQLTSGSGQPLTPIYLVPVRGTGVTGSIRPDYTGADIYTSGGRFLNPAAYVAPAAGQWGNAGRNSITGPSQFAMNASLARTFRMGDRLNADIRVDATNVLNHVTYPSWNTTVGSAQFGLPNSANTMRQIQSTFRLRF